MIFNQPQFLWGLFAVAIPIVIHLVNFRRYKKVYFSNVSRLTTLQTESRRRNTLRELLILAMRVLAVALLVIAFAQPTIPSREHALKAGSTVVSIYVDNSFSMDNASTGGSQMDVAKQKAREIASAYSLSDRYQLLTNDMDGVQFRWLNRDELMAAIEELQVSPASVNLSEVARRQNDFMARSGAANRHAYIVSDFQSSICDLDNMTADSSVVTMLVPLTAVAADNLYIDTLVLDAPAYFNGGAVEAEVTVVNSGSHDASKVPVRLFIADRERAIATVDVAAGATAKVRMHFTIDAEGWLDGRAEIADYPVTFDDSYYFAFHVGDRVKVLEVDASTQRNASLQKLFAADSSVEYKGVSMSYFDATSLDDVDLLVLNEPGNMASGMVHEVVQWVQEGGSLLVVPPAVQVPPSLNDLLGALHAPRLEQWLVRPVKATTVDHANSLYRNVFSAHSSDMEMPTVQGHYRLASGGALMQQLIALADGGGMLTATPSGEGTVYLFTMPLDAQHTDFVAQALFVPTLYNMALFSRPAAPASYTLGSSKLIVLQDHYDLATPVYLTLGDTYSAIPDIRQLGQRQVLVPHSDMRLAGHYMLRDEHLAFNYDRRESELVFMSRDEVAAQSSFDVVRNVDKPLDQEIRSRSEGHPLWRWCIVLALVALAVEVLLLKKKE